MAGEREQHCRDEEPTVTAWMSEKRMHRPTPSYLSAAQSHDEGLPYLDLKRDHEKPPGKEAGSGNPAIRALKACGPEALRPRLAAGLPLTGVQ